MSLKSIAEQAAHALGAVDLIRSRNRHHVRILMYHRFHDIAKLRAQCEHLARHYRPVSLDDIAGGRPLPPNALAITVDDGYHDFADAFPVFQEFGLKVTLYVVAGFAAGDLWLWPDQLLYLIENSRNRKAGQLAFDPICQAMIAMPNRERLQALRTLSEQVQVEIPATVPSRFAPLDWSQLKALAAKGLDIGAHTVTHPILSKLESGMEQEIAGAKAAIEAATGVTVNHFCYPNGKRPDVDPQAIALARSSGYRTAVLAESGFAGPPFSLFELKRLAVDPEQPRLYFERYVAGYRV